jgi:hypothetical protein
MTLTITSLRADHRSGVKSEVPYVIFNCTFRIKDDEHLHGAAKAESESYTKVLTIDDPKRYEEWIHTNWLRDYPGWGRAWTMQDPVWYYIEKFDTFWFREWISDTPVTRAIINELDYYRFFGKLPTVIRGTDEGAVLRHLRALDSYWD